MTNTLAWKPGDATKLAAFHRRHEQSIEPPLSPFAPPSDDPADYLLPVPDFDVAALMERDYFAAKAADAVLHEAPTLDGIRKGDLARVQTSNPRIPFVGRVDKLTWDGRVCVKQGDVCYWTRRERVTVLSRVEWLNYGD